MHGGDHGYGPPPPNQQHHPVSSLVSDRDWSRTARKSPDRYTPIMNHGQTMATVSPLLHHRSPLHYHHHKSEPDWRRVL